MRFDIAFPDAFAGRTLCFLVGEGIVYFTADINGIVSIKDKAMVKDIHKKGFVVVDADKF